MPEINTEAALCSRIHQGVRPNLKVLPSDTPSEVIEIMQACWDKDRAVRKSAAECQCILETLHYNLLHHPHASPMSNPTSDETQQKFFASLRNEDEDEVCCS